MSLPLPAAQLIGNYCETLTFGIYLATCCFCARTLLFIDDRLRRPSEIRWLMLSVATVHLVISVFDDIIGLVHNLAAFIWYNGSGGANQELLNIRDWINIARSTAQVMNIQLADLVLLYRCYIVYARSWSVITPSVVLYLAGVAAALRLLFAEVFTSTASNIAWWIVLFGVTVVQNLLTTSLLILRIWRVEHETRAIHVQTDSVPTQELPLRKVIRVIIESGAAYTTMLAMTFVVSLCSSNVLYPVSDATLQATGIVFNMLIVRCSPARDEQFTAFAENERCLAGHERRATLSSLHFRPGTTSAQNSIIEHVDIVISKSVKTDADSEKHDESS